MLNSVLFGPVDQLAASRDPASTPCAKHGRTRSRSPGSKDWGVSGRSVAPTDAQALAEAKDAEMWYQDSFRRFVIPERIEAAHPSLQPGFRAMAERLSQVTWDRLVAETLAFGSPDTVARHIESMRAMGVGQVLCWMNFGGLPQDKIRRSKTVRARGHAALPRRVARTMNPARRAVSATRFRVGEGAPSAGVPRAQGHGASGPHLR
jgi:hypothetical protein